jgi:hypothetical protein
MRKYQAGDVRLTQQSDTRHIHNFFPKGMVSMSAESNDNLSQIQLANRRRFLQRAGIAGAAVVGAGAFGLGQHSADAALSTSFGAKGHRKHVTDDDILNFALNLEYLEAEYYLRATTGSGLAASLTTGTGTQGTVTGGAQVTFTDPVIQGIAQQLATQELDHVVLLRTVLGKAAVAEPAINFTTAFNTLATAAGLITAGQTFDPFANQDDFLLGAFVFEDVGVTAYHGAAPYIVKDAYLEAAAGILAVEAYHAGGIRTELFSLGQTTAALITAANAISGVRASADGSGGAGNDGPLVANGAFILAPVDANGVAYARTFQEVINIASAFFPNKMNGVIS